MPGHRPSVPQPARSVRNLSPRNVISRMTQWDIDDPPTGGDPVTDFKEYPKHVIKDGVTHNVLSAEHEAMVMGHKPPEPEAEDAPTVDDEAAPTATAHHKPAGKPRAKKD